MKTKILIALLVMMTGVAVFNGYKWNMWKGLTYGWHNEAQRREQARIDQGQFTMKTLLSQGGAQILVVTAYNSGGATTTEYSFNKECNLEKVYTDSFNDSRFIRTQSIVFSKDSRAYDPTEEETTYLLKCD